VLERYGMTETLMNVSNPYDGERRPGSVGLPLPGVELRLSSGQEGEIQLRGPNVFSGYWEREEATAESFTEGWFRTGDLGSLDPDGYLRILGRSKELIISGGFNVYPREVEDVLLAHPDVAEVAVVGSRRRSGARSSRRSWFRSAMRQNPTPSSPSRLSSSPRSSVPAFFTSSTACPATPLARCSSTSCDRPTAPSRYTLWSRVRRGR
jgi:hypothetical protein